ncbi:cohesin complex subunit [Dimargaris xerosporica]|nr:cohesin complex subunit [Dimargaris xerosporica]
MAVAERRRSTRVRTAPSSHANDDLATSPVQSDSDAGSLNAESPDEWSDDALGNGTSTRGRKAAAGRRGRGKATRGRGARNVRQSRSLWDIDSVPEAQTALGKKAAQLVQTKRRRVGSGPGLMGWASQSGGTNTDDMAAMVDDSESSLFEAILDKDTAVASLVSDWIDTYAERPVEAIQELLGLIIRASGCTASITVPDLDDERLAQAALQGLQAKLKSESSPDFPMQSKSRAYKKFAKHCLDYFSRLLKQGQHVLIYSTGFMDTFSLWLTLMSMSTFRPFRYTSTVIALTVITTLCELHETLKQNISTAHRQLKTEQQKRRRGGATASQGRAQQLESNVAELNTQVELVGQQIDRWFEAIFTHRYRDMDAHIRQECIKGLALWISRMPSRFLDDQYLRYLGWVMSDKVPGVRQEALLALTSLYQQPVLLAGFTHFTRRFEHRMVTMALYDADVAGVRIQALELITLLIQQGLLNHALAQSLSQALTDTGLDTPGTTSHVTVAVCRSLQIPLPLTASVDEASEFCICNRSNLGEDSHTLACYDSQLARRLLVASPLQLFFIPQLFHPHDQVRHGTAALVAWWLEQEWLPAFTGLDLATDTDPLGLDATAQLESESEASDAESEASVNGSEALDASLSELHLDESSLESREHHAPLQSLTKPQARRLRLYKIVALVLDLFAQAGAMAESLPDQEAERLLTALSQPTEGRPSAQAIIAALDTRVCAAAQALAGETPGLLDWKCLCLYASLDHSYVVLADLQTVSVTTPLVTPSKRGRGARKAGTTPSRRTGRSRRQTALPTSASTPPAALRSLALTETQEAAFLDVLVECLKNVVGLPATAQLLERGLTSDTELATVVGLGRNTTRDRKRQLEQQEAQEELVGQLGQRLVALLPYLLSRYRADETKVTKVLCLLTHGALRLSVYLDMRKIKMLQALVGDLKVLYFKHHAPEVLQQVVDALRQVAVSGLLRDGDTNEGALNAQADGDQPPLDIDSAGEAFADLAKSVIAEVGRLFKQLHQLNPAVPLAHTVLHQADQPLVRELAVSLYRTGQLLQLFDLGLLADSTLQQQETPVPPSDATTFELTHQGQAVAKVVGPVVCNLLETMYCLPNVVAQGNCPLSAYAVMTQALRILFQQALWTLYRTAQPSATHGALDDAICASPGPESTSLRQLHCLQSYLLAQTTQWLTVDCPSAAKPPLKCLQHEMFHTQCQLHWAFISDVTHPARSEALISLRPAVPLNDQAVFTRFITATLADWFETLDETQLDSDELSASHSDPEDASGDAHDVATSRAKKTARQSASSAPSSDAALRQRLLALYHQSAGDYLRCLVLQLIDPEGLVTLVSYYTLLGGAYDELVKAACEQLLQQAPPVPQVSLAEYYQVLKGRQRTTEAFGSGLTESFELWMNRCRHLTNGTVALARMFAQGLKAMMTSHPNLPTVAPPATPGPQETPQRGPAHLTPQQQSYQLYRVVTSSVYKLHQEGLEYAISKLKGYLRLENAAAATRLLRFFKAMTPLVVGVLTPSQADSLKTIATSLLQEHDISAILPDSMDEDTLLTAKDWEPYHRYHRQLLKVADKLGAGVARAAPGSGQSAEAAVMDQTSDAPRRNLKRQFEEVQYDTDQPDNGTIENRQIANATSDHESEDEAEDDE